MTENESRLEESHAMIVKKNENYTNGNSWDIETDKIRISVQARDGKIYFTCLDGVQVNVWQKDNIKSFKDTTGFFLGEFR